MERFDEELELLLKCKTPIIEVVTFEWQRLQSITNVIAKDNLTKWKRWNRSVGIIDQDGNVEPIMDPLKLLNKFKEENESYYLILENFNLYLNNPDVINILFEICKMKRVQQKSLIIESAEICLPTPLAKEIVVLNMPLPNRTFIKKIAESVIINYNLPASNYSITAELLNSVLGLTTTEVNLAFIKAVEKFGKLDNSTIDYLISEKEHIIKKDGLLEYYHTDESMENVGGLTNLKKWLNVRSNAFTDKAKEFGIDTPKGVLLLGLPGCGKSLTAKCIASTWKYPLLRFDLGKVFGGIVGQSEANMRRALDVATTVAPCVLWIDEIEKGLSGLGSSDRTDGGTASRVFGSLLTWMQEKKEPVFVVATANNIESLPPELLRKGRFDEIFFVDLPSKEERKEIFKIHIQNKKRDISKFDLDLLADKTNGLTGSEIASLVSDSLFDAFSNGKDLDNYDIINNRVKLTPLSNYISTFIATVLSKKKFEIFGVKKLIDESPDIKLNKLLFAYTVFKNDISYFNLLIDVGTINLLTPEFDIIVDYYSFSQRKMMYTNMIYQYDKEEAIVKLFECINYSILRPYDSKEQLVSIFEPIALYMSHKYKLLANDEETKLLEMNLKQYDVIADTLYRSTFPDYLNYLLDCIEHDFDYSFRYDVGKAEPMSFDYDTSKKVFDSNFVQNDGDDSYRVDSFGFWCSCIDYLKKNDNELWIYEYLDNNYYPSMSWSKISRYAYLIIGAMHKINFNSSKLFAYLMDKMNMDGYFQLLKSFIVCGEIPLAIKMIKQIFEFTNLMVFYDRKHYNNITYTIKLNKKIINTVFNSSIDDYIYVDNESALMYEKNPDIIIRLPNIFNENQYEDYSCEEATFFGHTPKKELYRVFYKNHLIYDFYLLSVDGGRATIPLIDDYTGEYDIRDINLAKLFCKADKIYEYLNMIKYNFDKKNK